MLKPAPQNRPCRTEAICLSPAVTGFRFFLMEFFSRLETKKKARKFHDSRLVTKKWASASRFKRISFDAVETQGSAPLWGLGTPKNEPSTQGKNLGTPP